MPRMSGLESMDALRSRHPDAKIQLARSGVRRERFAQAA